MPFFLFFERKLRKYSFKFYFDEKEIKLSRNFLGTSERFVVFRRVLSVLATTAGLEADHGAAVASVSFVVDLAIVSVRSAEHHVLLCPHLAVHAVHI